MTGGCVLASIICNIRSDCLLVTQVMSALEADTWAAYRSSGWSIDLDFHHLSFNNLRLFSVKRNPLWTVIHFKRWELQNTTIVFAHSLDPHSDGFSKSLAECLGLAHLQGEDLTSGQRCEGCIRAKRLGDACIKNNISAEPMLSQCVWEQELLLWRKYNLSQLHQWKATIWLPGEDDEMILCSGKPPMWPLPIAMAVFPVPGWPAISTALPAMWPSLIISRMTPAARREASWPTIPWDTCRGIGTGIIEAKFNTY